MKTLYTLIFIVALTGCNYDVQEARSTTSAFLNNCKSGTVITNVVNSGDNKKLTITCEKDGN